jgi:hypothetical protein
VAGRAGTSALSAVASVAAAALGLCAVAIYNGFPLVWHDTSSHLANALDTLYQLGRFETGWEFGPYGEGPDSPGASVPREIRTFFPGSFRAYSEARQQQGTLPIEAVRRVHRDVFLASLAVNAVFLAWTWIRRWARPPGLDPPPWRALPALILLIGVGVVANALVAGGLAQVADRYGSRVAWLVVWSALLCLAAPLAARRGGPALSV